MQQILKELTELHNTIEENKKEADQLEGRNQEVIEQIKTEGAVKTIEEAKTKKLNLKKELDQLEISIQKDFKFLKEKYEW